MQRIDDFLNSITMYKTVLYGLITLVISSFIASFMGALPFPAVVLVISLFLILGVCFLSNYLLSKIFRAPTNSESYLISALIIYFIFSPAVNDVTELIPLILASFFAMASKYIIAIKRKHIFNPVAIAAVLVVPLGYGASWWVATPVLLPAVLIVGLLIVRKIRKFSMFFAFLAVVVVEMLLFGLAYNTSPFSVISQLLLSWPLLFFAAVMLTEPLTTPPTRYLQILYGSLVGFLFAFQLPLGPILLSPELSLIVGNVFSYIVSSKQRVILRLERIEKLSSSIYNFIFSPSEKLFFEPGQYVEWTLPHVNTDSRGNRRFFTVASSPTEKNIILGVRIEEDSSSFKKALLGLSKKNKVTIGNLSGDFTLPSKKDEKLVFIAGGIGITPFRSIIKYLADNNEKRDIVLFHICSHVEDFVYDEVFKQSESIGVKIIRVLTEKEQGSGKSFNGLFGHLTNGMIKNEVPDYKKRRFYISGSNTIVNASKEILKELNIDSSKIVTDYFSGY